MTGPPFLFLSLGPKKAGNRSPRLESSFRTNLLYYCGPLLLVLLLTTGAATITEYC